MQTARGNNTQFQFLTVILKPTEFYEVESRTLLLGLISTTPIYMHTYIVIVLTPV